MFIIKDGTIEHREANICRIRFGSTSHYNYNYTNKYIDVKDNNKLRLRAGDIIKLPDHEYCKYGKKIRGEMAVVLNRYKKIKTTEFGTVYIDYGAEFMMISGEEKGKIKKRLLLPSYLKFL